MKKVAVLQSNYIPWKGYFDIIHDVDLFIFHDDLQYTKNDWRNRNKIYSQNGPLWLSIPVGTNEHRLILDVKMNDKKWQKEHFNRIKMSYSKAPYFKKYLDFIEYVYLEKQWDYLYELDRFIITKISKDFLGCNTVFGDSRDYNPQGSKHEKLLNLLVNCEADLYVSGPAAKDYIISKDYEKAGIKLAWKNYEGYPNYKQFDYEFNHYVSILDLLFHTGDEAPYYIWGWRKEGDSPYIMD